MDHLEEGKEPPPPGVHTAAIVRWVIIGAVTLVALWSVAAWLGVFDRGGDGHAGHEETALYTCPMHPTITSDRPGQCPICGMDLVLIDRRAGNGAVTTTSQVAGLAVVELPEDRLQRIGVRTAPAERKVLSNPVRTVALVAADESRLARVQTRFSGWIEKLQVSQTGQRVKKGEVMAEIFSRELYVAQQEFLSGAGLQKEARQRLELLGVSPQDIDAVQKKGEPIRALPVRAPASGHVTFKSAVEGIFVEPGTELFEIADLSRIWAWANVYERDLSRVPVGAKATLTVVALPGRKFEGKIGFVQPVVDPASRTVQARVELANPDLALKPGMYGEVEIAAEARESIVIPREALVDTGDTQYVYVEVGPGRYQPRRVVIGTSGGDDVAVLEGVAEGERVVTSGNFLLDSESRLRAVAEAAMKSGRTDVPIDKDEFPEKYEAWIRCEQQHRGMGSMEDDCKNAIPKPWR